MEPEPVTAAAAGRPNPAGRLTEPQARQGGGDAGGGHDAPSRQPVDWGVAADVAAGLVRTGPTASRAELADLVAELRAAGTVAIDHVVRISGLHPATGSVADISRTVVVDRRGWVRANARMLSVLTSGASTSEGSTASTSLGRWSAGVQTGTVLAVVSSRVLGQFDPFSGAHPGTLLLVAPNVLSMERSLGVVPADFRVWVALHEQTHALQFATAPWLAEHLRSRVGRLLVELTGDQPSADGHPLLSRVTGALQGRDDAPAGIEKMLTPSQREVFDELGALMSLLEGHADVMMDEVGPEVVPSVRAIRERFDARRRGVGRVDRLVRNVLGLEQKMAQYRDGAAFVREVVSRVGLVGLNAVWVGPANLPTMREVADPRAWVRRVHG